MRKEDKEKLEGIHDVLIWILIVTTEIHKEQEWSTNEV